MTSRSPFDFDISVGAAKRRKAATRRKSPAIPETGGQHCHYPDCSNPGQFRAPKSPDMLDEFFWFCKSHIREYNLKWNFFDGANDEEFQKFLEKERVWERETKPFSRQGDGNAWARMGVKDPLEILGDKGTQENSTRAGSSRARKLPPTERRALEILDVGDTLSKQEIRRQYKALIKTLHPDMNGGDRGQEVMLQEVVWAWDQIKDSRNFQD